MKRPGWVTAVGVIAIILGALGVLGAVNMFFLPTVMSMQEQIMTAMVQEMEKQAAANPQQQPPKEMFEAMVKMWQAPPWFKTAAVVAGAVGLPIAGFYILSGIMLLHLKPIAPRLFYAAAGVALAFSLARIIMGALAGSIMAMGFIASGGFGFVIHTTLLLIVALNRKDAFAVHPAVLPVENP